MSNDNQTSFNEKNTFVREEDTEISLPPPAPNFEAAEPAPVQPVIPVASVPDELLGALPQQPQVIYVAQPTTVQPTRSWGWIPAALSLLLVAIIAGIFIGAELYKRSIYAESSTPYTTQDVLPDVNSTGNENKSAKSEEENLLADKKENDSPENTKSSDVTSGSKLLNSVSTGFAPIQRTDLKETRNNSARQEENASEENNQEIAEKTDEESGAGDENNAENNKQGTESEDDEPPPPPVKQKSKELKPKKVENIKDTDNITPPQRSLPD
ncbi:MAG: hypothetical protein M3209_12030 [Acidobacteriota bacterium]|nr:hypothetical protein [Acidobacteriota bacterium]